jgi:hypothetical protein
MSSSRRHVRVRELHGDMVVWITPDEVATVLANLEAFKPIAAIKRLFPGAEMVDVHTCGQGLEADSPMDAALKDLT